MLLIFDWDGTLSDSTATIVSAMQRAAESIGLGVPDDDAVRNIIGLGLPEALAVLYPGITDDALLQMRERYSAHFLEIDQHKPSEFYPGVLDTLDRLRGDGFTLAVATGKSRRGLDRVLGSLGMQGFFHGSRCADETASKPDPRMLQELMAEFAFTSELSVMVGDTEYDMDMACRAGVHPIAVNYGAHAPERLQIFNPVLSMDQFAEILAWEGLGSLCVRS